MSLGSFEYCFAEESRDPGSPPGHIEVTTYMVIVDHDTGDEDVAERHIDASFPFGPCRGTAGHVFRYGGERCLCGQFRRFSKNSERSMVKAAR